MIMHIMERCANITQESKTETYLVLVLHEGETEGGHKLWEATGRTSHEQATKGIFNRTDIHLVEAKCISLYKTVFFF